MSRRLRRGRFPRALPWASTARRMGPFAKQEQRTADFDPVAVVERLPSVDRHPVDADHPAGRGADKEILAFAADDRMLRQHRLVAEQPDVALFGPPDDR